MHLRACAWERKDVSLSGSVSANLARVQSRAFVFGLDTAFVCTLMCVRARSCVRMNTRIQALIWHAN